MCFQKNNNTEVFWNENDCVITKFPTTTTSTTTNTTTNSVCDNKYVKKIKDAKFNYIIYNELIKVYNHNKYKFIQSINSLSESGICTSNELLSISPDLFESINTTIFNYNNIDSSTNYSDKYDTIYNDVITNVTNIFKENYYEENYKENYKKNQAADFRV